MEKETCRGSDKNEFKDFTFSSEGWSAPTLISVEEIKTQLAALKLEGRTIARTKLIDFSYCHDRGLIEEHAYRVQDRLDEKERQKRAAAVAQSKRSGFLEAQRNVQNAAERYA